MDDDMLSGLNVLVNQADKPQKAAVKAARADEPVVQQPATDIGMGQVLTRLDGIKSAIDALRNTQGAPAVQPEKPEVAEKPAAGPIPAASPKASPHPTLAVPPQQATPQQGVTPLQGAWWPYLILVSAALELVAFALGMGYGAIVASGKFPFWYRPGVAGVLIDWVAAPAGILLLPVIAALLFLGGRELQRDGRDTAAKAVWAVAGGLIVIALLVPFIA